MKKVFYFLSKSYKQLEDQKIFSKIMVICLVLVFVVAPLAEFVTHLDYHYIESYPIITCLSGIEFVEDPLVFSEIR